MYSDHSPVPNWPKDVERVLVLEENDKGCNPDDVIEMAREIGATNSDGDNDEIFWVVFYNNPRRVWDFTEKALRREFSGQGSWARQ